MITLPIPVAEDVPRHQGGSVCLHRAAFNDRAARVGIAGSQLQSTCARFDQISGVRTADDSRQISRISAGSLNYLDVTGGIGASGTTVQRNRIQKV